MFSKVILLLMSVLFFVAAGLTNISSAGKASSFIKLFLLLLVSFVSLTVFFIKTDKFQDILDRKPNRALIITLISSGIIFYLIVSYLLHGANSDYVMGIALDSVSYFTQAHIFSTGNLSVPSHDLKEFFTTGYFINDGRFYTKYFPGWPLLLSLGVLMGAPWVMNPLFGFLTLILIYLLGREIYDREAGLVAVLVALFSANFYLLNTSYLSEPSSLFFSVLFFYLIVKVLKKPGPGIAVLAGLSLGVAFLIRPYSAFAISLPVLSYFIYSFVIKKEKCFNSFIIFSLSFLPSLVMLLAYNYLQTGSVFVNTYEYYNPYDKLGFGLRSPDIFLKPVLYTWVGALKNMSMNLGIMNWAGVPLLFIFLFLVLMNKKNKWDFILLATVLSIIFFQFFYHAKSSRYYHPSFFALTLLTARGLSLSGPFIQKIFPHKPVKNLNRLLLIFIVAANIFVVISPKRVLQRHKMYTLLRDPFTLAKKNNLSNSVIFLKSVPESYNNISYYVQNPLNFDGDVLFVRDLKEKNVELMEYYPEKEFYVYEFKRKTKSGKLTGLRRSLGAEFYNDAK